MGTFLSVPVTDVETEEGSSSELGLAFGVSAMQGWRSGEFGKGYVAFCRLHKRRSAAAKHNKAALSLLFLNVLLFIDAKPFFPPFFFFVPHEICLKAWRTRTSATWASTTPSG